ncbi:Major facilitator family transporter, partial [Pseudomonas amygdali pv. photiniae]
TGSIQGGLYGLAATSLLAAVVIFFARTTPRGDLRRPSRDEPAKPHRAVVPGTPSSLKPDHRETAL